MPPLVTADATILCSHGGQVILTPGQTEVQAGGAPVLCEPDLEGAPISGCLQPATPTTAPCTAIVSILPGSTSLPVDAGAPVYLATLQGITNGVPPGTLIVADAGQVSVEG